MNSRSVISRRVGLGIAAGSALLFALYGFVEGLFHDQLRVSVLEYAAAFACFGFMIGVILAFDTESGDRHSNRPVLRTLLSALAGLAFGIVLAFSPEGIALSTLVAAMLGYVGLVWAKYI